MYFKIVTGISIVIVVSGSALAEYPPLAVSPDSLADVSASARPDLFGAKGAKSSAGSVKPESSLSTDPMLKSLKQFFEAIWPK